VSDPDQQLFPRSIASITPAIAPSLAPTLHASVDRMVRRLDDDRRNGMQFHAETTAGIESSLRLVAALLPIDAHVANITRHRSDGEPTR
jgi:hypothetical protein